MDECAKLPNDCNLDTVEVQVTSRSTKAETDQWY